MSTPPFLDVLQKMPVFGGLKEETLATLLDLADRVSCPRGDFFFREGERGASMFVLMEGRVAVLKTWEEHNYLLAHLGVGDCFGEMSLLDLRPRSAAVLAVAPCLAVEITTRHLHSIYERDVHEFTMIHMNMGREVSRRLRAADEMLFRARVEAKAIGGKYVFRPEEA